MDGEAWWVSVHGITRVRHDLVTQPPYTSNIIALLGKKKIQTVFTVFIL